MSSRAEAVREEMCAAIKSLGEDGANGKAKIAIAAMRAKLSFNEAARLRYKKIKRVYADIADQVREAVAEKTIQNRAAARHDFELLRLQMQALAHRLDNTDADFHGLDVDALRQPLAGGRELAGAYRDQSRSGDHPPD